MYKKIAAISILLSLILSGCSRIGLVVRAEYPSAKERPRTVEESMLQAVQNFSLETSAELLGENPGSTLYSPLSLYYALAMTAEGAAGTTRKEMNTLLGVDNEENFAKNCGELYRYLYRNQDDHVLQIANSLWIQEGVEFREEYRQQMKDNFYASLYAVDFGAQQTAEQMGKWVSEQTGGLLEYEYIPDPSRILTLLNTVWLKDACRTRFMEAGTQDDTFYHPDGTETQMPFMQLTDSGMVYRGEGWLRASLPLRTCGSILFVLPDEDVSLADLYVDANTLSETLYGGTSTNAEISWYVPKIRIESTLELREYLEEKIPTAFSPEADLSGMLKETSGYISDVRQKTYLEWDEEGVAAAAYTEVSVNESALQIDTSIPMHLNRPFLFAVMTEDLPVFIGYYS